MCRIFICGTSSYKRAYTPGEYDQPILRDVVCPFCNHRGDAIYREKVKKCTFCFIIPCCTIRKEQAQMTCFSCFKDFGKGEIKICNRCRTVMISGFNFCVKCGTRAVI